MAVAVVGDVSSGEVVGPAPQPVPPRVDRLDPLRLRAERHAGNAVEERLLLETTGVGVDAGRVHDQARHVEVAEWRARDEPATTERRVEARGVDLAARPRVHREHDGLTGRDLPQVREHRGERVVVVGRLGPVHGRDGVAAGLDTEPVEEVGRLGVDLGARQQRGVVHHVADVVHTVDDVLGREVAHCRRCRAEQHVGHVVGEHAVALLAHHAVERPEAGLDVRERDAHARRREGRGERRVGVPVDEHRVGLLVVECARRWLRACARGARARRRRGGRAPGPAGRR